MSGIPTKNIDIKANTKKQTIRVFILLADGFEEVEALSPVDYLRRAGASVTLVSISDKVAVTGAHGITVQTDLLLDVFIKTPVLPDAVYIPGGMPGAKNISNCVSAVGFISTMFRSGRIVTAICAAPVVVLAKTGILKGKKYTCYGDMKDEIPQWAGKAYHDLTLGSEKLDKAVVRDGTLLTGNAPGAAEELSIELIKVLFGDSKAADVAKGAFLRPARA